LRIVSLSLLVTIYSFSFYLTGRCLPENCSVSLLVTIYFFFLYLTGERFTSCHNLLHHPLLHRMNLCLRIVNDSLLVTIYSLTEKCLPQNCEHFTSSQILPLSHFFTCNYLPENCECLFLLLLCLYLTMTDCVCLRTVTVPPRVTIYSGSQYFLSYMWLSAWEL
jgi:hypothetical protein